MAELIDLFMPTPFNITLVAAIYIIHRSLYKVETTGFLTGLIIALCANFYMTAYLNIHPIAAMFISIVLFPVMELLWALSKKGFGKEQEIPHWHRPHLHSPKYPPQRQ